MDTIGQQIREARKQKGFTQEQLAEKVDRNLRTVQRIENSENAPRNETLNLICEVLEIDLETFSEEKNVKDAKTKKIANLIARGLFLIILNFCLMLVTGYFTLDDPNSINSRVGGYLLSFFIPFFISLLTQKMSGLERMFKFGSGYIFFFILRAISVPLISPVLPSQIFGFYPCLIISVMVLFYGNEIISLLRLNKENNK